MELIDKIEKEIKQSLAYNQYDIVEKDVIEVLIKLLKMFLIFFRQESKDSLNLIVIDEEDIKQLKQELIQFLITKKYPKKDFTILKVEIFDKSI